MMMIDSFGSWLTNNFFLLHLANNFLLINTHIVIFTKGCDWRDICCNFFQSSFKLDIPAE